MAAKTCRACGRPIAASTLFTHGMCGQCYALVPPAVPLDGEPPIYASLSKLTVERLRQGRQEGAEQ